ncbi:MAG TPA: trigger factor [Acidimicrobiales bacterium]|nr:trigger factor [Acidimicrobiales bacterium]
MRTSVEPLEGNKVKLTVEVDEEDVRRAEDETLRRLVREVRVPGFRPGKVPRRLLEARLGPKAIRDEVLRDALPRYYTEAVEEAELDVITNPEIDVTSGEEAGPVSFDAVVEVRPEVSVAGYEGLVVTVPGPEATDEDIAAQVDRLRDQFATLNEVDRPIRDGDIVTLDMHGTRDGEPAEGLTADDLVYQAGSGGIVQGIDERLFGAKVGEIFELVADDAPGGAAHLKVLVKQVREKILPEPDDDFASDASEFDTFEELRSDLAGRISEVKRLQASSALRERAVEALVGLVADEVPASLVATEAERLLHDFAHRLARQQVGLDDYLRATGQEPDAFMQDIQAEATNQVKADLALRALAKAEEIEVDESDLDDELVRLAEQGRTTPAQLRAALERDGRVAGLRSQLKNSKALAWLIEHVDVVDEEGNAMDRSVLLAGDDAEADNTESVAAGATTLAEEG